MNYYWIESGEYLKISVAATPREAAIKSFKHDEPENTDLITEVRSWPDAEYKQRSVFFKTGELLQDAGFLVD